MKNVRPKLRCITRKVPSIFKMKLSGGQNMKSKVRSTQIVGFKRNNNLTAKTLVQTILINLQDIFWEFSCNASDNISQEE